MWGVRENRSIDVYGDAILGVHNAIPKMLDIFDKYGVKSTFAAVGFLFLKNKEELLAHIPALMPSYVNPKVSPYGTYIDSLESFADDRYHFAPHIIEDLKTRENCEIATHTLSHYNALAEGQTKESFRADLREAIKIANEKGVQIRSIVFPRNQCNADYLEACKELGIICYRGKDRYKRGKKPSSIDRYIPLFNDRPYQIDDIYGEPIINLWGSEHWRPNINSNAILDRFKTRVRTNRIKRSMSLAAKNNLIYHIWWHPHEFGRYTEEKLAVLEDVCAHYRRLNDKYGFQSATMGEFAQKVLR
jgi:peptidoglycan/xylan/chitin deacetylase (PgdA/CDA1 family)